MSNIYHVPLVLREQHAAENILKLFDLPAKQADMSEWETLAARVDSVEKEVRIAIVGKYTHLCDSYISVSKVAIGAAAHE